MITRSTSMLTFSLLIIGSWLLIYVITIEHNPTLLWIGLGFFAIATLMLRDREQFAGFVMRHRPMAMNTLFLIIMLMLMVIAIWSDFAHLWLLSTLIVFAFAADFGIRMAIYSSIATIAVLAVDVYQHSSLSFSAIDSQWVLIYSMILFISILYGRKTDLHYQATYIDDVTGLYSRHHFVRTLANRIASDHTQQQQLAVVFIDIRQFQQLNENLGHSFGDQLLHAMANRFTEITNGLISDSHRSHIWRYDADQFVILLEGFENLQACETFVQQLLQQFELPWKLFEHELQLQVIAGMALYPQHNKHSRHLIEQAKIALSRAKQQRLSLCVYTHEANTSYTERFVIEAGLRRAIEQEEFVIYYQPKIEIHSGDVIGIEALIRWEHPELGLLQPNKFIAIAEETGLIVELGEWILRSACQQHAVWLEQKQPSIRICVNVSLKQLEQPDFVPRLQTIVHETGLQPHHLELELTESLAINNSEQLKDVLRTLADLGIKLTIDDFGTGYASYNHLSQLPIHALKIDKSFMRGINQNPDAEAIVASIIQLAKSLHLTVTAEGVENFEQLMFLKRNSCDEVQGYLYLHPQPANVFEPYLRRGFAHISQTFQ